MSIGADPGQSTLALGTFELGASTVSLLAAPWLFRGARPRRRFGLLVGTGIGLVGTALAAASLVLSSPGLFLVATYCFGCAMGIGFYLRFAALELVPSHWSSFAVGLVVGGGCIAAIAAPEAAWGTTNMFGNDRTNLKYMGVILLTGIFNLLNTFFVSLIQFPAPNLGPSGVEAAAPTSSTIYYFTELRPLLVRRTFWIPMAMAALSWALMVLPMCVVRLAMLEAGFGPRAGVTVMEGHFLGMYATGFVSGKLIQRLGARTVAWGAVMLFLASIAVLQLADDSTVATWIVGMVVLGIAWNLGFTSATVWTTTGAYDDETQPHLKAPVQAANDFFMFLFVGGWVMGSTYIFESAGGSIKGWRAVTGPVLGALLALAAALLLVDAILLRRERGGKVSPLPI
jgi:hypothetical protein